MRRALPLENVSVITLTAFVGSLFLPVLAEAASTPVGVKVAYAAELTHAANALAESSSFIAPPDLSDLLGESPELLDPATLVNARNGNVLFTETDLTLNSESSLPIAIERTWNAFAPQTNGMFGLGWRTAFETSIAADSRGDLRLTEPDGYVVTFSRDGQNAKTARARISRDIAAAVKKEHETSGVVQSDDYYDRLGERLAIDDPYFLEHRDLHPSARAAGLPFQISERSERGRAAGSGPGVYFSVERGRQRISASADGWMRRLADGTVQRFDRKGRIVRIDAPSGAVLRLVRGANGSITAITDDATARVLRFSYDKAGRAVAAKDSLEREVRYAYDQQGHLLQMTRPDMKGTRYEWQGDRLYRVTRADGSAITIGYDADMRCARISGPGTRQAAFHYETLATAPPRSVTTITDSLGATKTIAWDDKEGTVTETDAMGAVRTTWFGANGLPVREKNALANIATYEYDARGNLVAARDAAGRVTKTTFDAEGRPLVRTSPDGRETSWTWDAKGNLLEEKSTGGARTAYKWDAQSRLVAMQDAIGAVTKIAWDRHGNRAAETDAAGAVTRREADAAGRLLSETDARGGITRYAYDRAGNLASVTEPSARVTSYRYDLLGRMTGLARTGNPELLVKWSSTGRPEKVSTAAASGVSSWDLTWNSEGRLTKMTAPNGAAWTVRHDALGRTTAIVDPLGSQTAFEYDAAGRVVSQTLPGGVQETFDWDAAGNLLRRTNAAARSRVSFTYDAAGRVTSVTNPMRAVTRIEYDAAGRVAKVLDADGGTSAFRYDAAGRRTSFVDAKGITTNWAWDKAGNLVGLSDPSASVRIVRDDAGDVTGLATNGGYQVTFLRDADGNITTISDKGGRKASFKRDAAARVTAMDAPMGRFEYAYDAAGRVTKVAGPDGADLWKYDAMGNAVEHRDPAGRMTSWTYDARGERTSTKKSDGRTSETWKYERDANGRPAAFTDPKGVRTVFQYDAAGNLTKAGDPSGAQALYEYNAAGQMIGAPLAGGGRGRFQWSPAGNLLGVKKQEAASQASTPAKPHSSLLPELLPGDRFADAGDGDTLYASLGAFAPASSIGRVDSGNRRGTLNGAVVKTKSGTADPNGGVPNPNDPNDPNNPNGQGGDPGEILSKVMEAIEKLKELLGGGGGKGGGGGGSGSGSGGGGSGSGSGGGSGSGSGSGSKPNPVSMPGDSSNPNGPIDMDQLLKNLQELTNPSMNVPGVGEMVAKALGELVVSELAAMTELFKALLAGDVKGVVKAIGMLQTALKKFETAIKKAIQVKRAGEAIQAIGAIAAEAGNRVRAALSTRGALGTATRILSVGRAITAGSNADDAEAAGMSR